MTANFIELARPDVQSMQAYQPGKPVEEAQREFGLESVIKLASNENPRGPSPLVADAVAAAIPEMHRYPDANGYYLKQLLAEQHGVSIDQITLGCGSNDILELVASAYLDRGSSAIYSQYGFLVYALATARSGAKAIVVPAVAYGHDLSAMAAAVEKNTRVIYIANPNNPTGTYANKASLLALLDGVPRSIVIVLDEAYAEYIDKADYPSGLALLDRYPNLVVTRTFSKAYGLGGLRVGYSVSNADVADMLNRVRQPFNVTSLSLIAAQVALRDENYLAQSIALNRSGMQQLTEGLRAQQIDFIDSVANFVSFKSPINAVAVNQALLERGVIVRPVANYGMTDYLRVSIGLEEENSVFLQTLAQVLSTLDTGS